MVGNSSGSVYVTQVCATQSSCCCKSALTVIDRVVSYWPVLNGDLEFERFACKFCGGETHTPDCVNGRHDDIFRLAMGA
jgi:hypothetical protein